MERPGAELVEFRNGPSAAAAVVRRDGGHAAVSRRRTASSRSAAAILNLTGERFAYNFGNPFSGTHFGRAARFRLACRYDWAGSSSRSLSSRSSNPRKEVIYAALRRRISDRCSKEKARCLPAYLPEGRKNLERVRRARVHRMRGRRSEDQNGNGDAVCESRQNEGRRDGGLFVDSLQVEGRPRSHQQESDEGSAPGEHDGPEVDAVRHEADGVRRVPRSSSIM